MGPRVSGRCADTISSPCRNSYPESSTPVAQSPKHIYQIRTNNLLSQFPRVSLLIVVHPISNPLISVLPTRVMKVVGKVHLWLLCVRTIDSAVCTVMCRLTTGIRSEKCFVRRFHRCANLYLHKTR